LRAEEEKDYLSRLEKNDTATLDNFFAYIHEFTSLKYRMNGLPLKYLRKPERHIGKTEYAYYVKCTE
jgi:hypothetical protein